MLWFRSPTGVHVVAVMPKGCQQPNPPACRVPVDNRERTTFHHPVRLTGLTVKGFGAYQQQCQLDLTDVPIAVIVGDNGAGKSTLLNALLWCLYGETPGRQAMRDLVNETSGNKMEVTVEFEHTDGYGDTDHAQHEHLVHRVYELRASGSDSGDASHTCDGELISTGRDAVTDSVTQLLGADVTVLCSTMLSRQFDCGMFNQGSNNDRMRVLMTALPLAEFQQQHEQSTEAYDEAKEATAEVARDVRDAQIAVEQLTDLEAAVAAASAAERAAADHHNQLLSKPQVDQNELLAAREAVREVAALDQTITDLEKQEEPLNELYQQALADTEELTALGLKAKEMAQQLEMQSAKANALAEGSAENAEIARQRLDLLETGDLSECFACGQAMDATHIGQLRETLNDTINRHDAHEAAAVEADRKHQAAVKLSRQKNQQADAADRAAAKTLQQLETTRKSLNEKQNARQRASEVAANLKELERTARGAPTRQELAEAAVAARDTAAATGAAERDLQLAQDKATRKDELIDSHKRASTWEDGVKLLKRATSPGGIRQIATINLLYQVTDEANAVLARLGSDLSVRLGGGSADSVDVDTDGLAGSMVVEARERATRQWRPYGSFSGGEQMRIDVATRLGLMRALNVQCDMFVLDEGWGVLDQAGRRALEMLLNQLVDTGEVRQVLTTSHITETVDAFPASIEVTSDPLTGSSAKVVHTGALADWAALLSGDTDTADNPSDTAADGTDADLVDEWLEVAANDS